MNPIDDFAKNEHQQWAAPGRLNAAVRFRDKSAAMGTPLTLALVDAASLEAHMNCLDLASGTGEPAITIATRLAGTGHVVATDINSAVLGIARSRAAERGLSNIEFQTADAHELPFPNAVFDRVTCRLGVMFFANAARALNEAHRVLRPGGRIVLAAWGPFEQPYFTTSIGTILRLFPQASFSPPAIFRFSEPDLLADILHESGFKAVHAELRAIAWAWNGTASELWQYFQEVTAPFRRLIDSIPAAQLPTVVSGIEHAFESRRRGPLLEFDAQFVFATAERI